MRCNNRRLLGAHAPRSLVLTSTVLKEKSKNDYNTDKNSKNNKGCYHCRPPPTWYSVTLVSKRETALSFDKAQTISSPSSSHREWRGHALRISPTLLDSPREITLPLRLSIVVEPFRCLGSLDERTRLLITTIRDFSSIHVRLFRPRCSIARTLTSSN